MASGSEVEQYGNIFLSARGNVRPRRVSATQESYPTRAAARRAEGGAQRLRLAQRGNWARRGSVQRRYAPSRPRQVSAVGVGTSAPSESCRRQPPTRSSPQKKIVLTPNAGADLDSVTWTRIPGSRQLTLASKARAASARLPWPEQLCRRVLLLCSTALMTRASRS